MVIKITFTNLFVNDTWDVQFYYLRDSERERNISKDEKQEKVGH